MQLRCLRFIDSIYTAIVIGSCWVMNKLSPYSTLLCYLRLPIKLHWRFVIFQLGTETLYLPALSFFKVILVHSKTLRPPVLSKRLALQCNKNFICCTIAEEMMSCIAQNVFVIWLFHKAQNHPILNEWLITKLMYRQNCCRNASNLSEWGVRMHHY